MGEVALTVPALPDERHYRPVRRGPYYARSLPLALAFGLGAGALVLAIPLDPLLTVVGIWGVVIWRLIRTRRRAHTIARDTDEAQALLAAGELDTAAEAFEELCRAGTSMPAFHCLLVYNRAVAYLRSGELERASSLLHAVLDAGWFSVKGSAFGTHLPMVYSTLAACSALQGQVKAAIQWRERAHASISDVKRGQLLAVDVLVDGRCGAFDRVLARVSETLPRAENLLTASQLRLVRLVQAFALERRHVSRYREQSHRGEIQACLAAGRPSRPEELRHVVENWPEFREFLGLFGVMEDQDE